MEEVTNSTWAIGNGTGNAIYGVAIVGDYIYVVYTRKAAGSFEVWLAKYDKSLGHEDYAEICDKAEMSSDGWFDCIEVGGYLYINSTYKIHKVDPSDLSVVETLDFAWDGGDDSVLRAICITKMCASDDEKWLYVGCRVSTEAAYPNHWSHAIQRVDLETFTRAGGIMNFNRIGENCDKNYVVPNGMVFVDPNIFVTFWGEWDNSYWRDTWPDRYDDSGNSNGVFEDSFVSAIAKGWANRAARPYERYFYYPPWCEHEDYYFHDAGDNMTDDVDWINPDWTWKWNGGTSETSVWGDNRLYPRASRHGLGFCPGVGGLFYSHGTGKNSLYVAVGEDSTWGLSGKAVDWKLLKYDMRAFKADATWQVEGISMGGSWYLSKHPNAAGAYGKFLYTIEEKYSDELGYAERRIVGIDTDTAQIIDSYEFDDLHGYNCENFIIEGGFIYSFEMSSTNQNATKLSLFGNANPLWDDDASHNKLLTSVSLDTADGFHIGDGDTYLNESGSDYYYMAVGVEE
jgi:hypothetical protein